MRKSFVLVAFGVLAAGLLTNSVSAAGTSSANACASLGAPASVGRIGGIVSAQAITTACPAQNTSDAANGTPPLLWNGGPVMGTFRTGPVVVTPIYWSPYGHPMDPRYKNVITTYLDGVARDSGRHTNVFSTLNEYWGSNGRINYRIRLGRPVYDYHPLPADGCTLESVDTTGIYADNSGYNACLDDDQVIAETDRVVSALRAPRDLGHIYVMFLPKGAESCFYPGATDTFNNFCTINHLPSAAYCAYHSMAPDGMVYANLAYPIYASPIGYTCGSDSRFPAIESPNHNLDADTQVSPTSHEIMEAITDPDTETGWYDSSGFENGDECAYVYGQTYGTPGQLFNQVIAHHRYLTQEEFSNQDFFQTGGGCLQSEGFWH